MTTTRLRDSATGRFISAQAAAVVTEPAPGTKKGKGKQDEKNSKKLETSSKKKSGKKTNKKRKKKKG